MCVKIPVDQQFLRYLDQSIRHQQLCHVKVTHIPPGPRSDAQYELQQVVLTTSVYLNAVSCWYVIG